MQFTLISNTISSLSSSLFSITLALLLISIVYFFFKNKGLPPGPIGLPYFGYWPFIKSDECHLQLDALKKKYGDIFSFVCTGQLYINLGSIKAVREACLTKSEFFGDRPSGYNLMCRFFSNGVLAINGDKWKASRKFFMVLLKERGANSLKTSIAGPLYDSLQLVVRDIKAKKGEPLNLIQLFMEECCTIVRLTLFGEIGITQEQIRKINDLNINEVKCFLPKTILLYGTFAKYFIFPFMPNYLESISCHTKIKKIVQDIIKEHKTTYDPENPRDIIDEYFKERDKRQSKGDPSAEYFTDEVLMGSLIQFMGDGALITASFASMLMVGLLHHPEEQDKLYKEIIEVVGSDRQPTLEDKGKLTYFNAYIQESIRVSELLHFFLTQQCKRETTLGGYRIPKGAILVQNFYSCHHDLETYEHPEKFNPSRFISGNGKRKAELPVLFGVGKRSCIGEGFVMMQVFLLMATIVQNFHLTLPEGTKISNESFLNSNLMVCAKPRDKQLPI